MAFKLGDKPEQADTKSIAVIFTENQLNSIRAIAAKNKTSFGEELRSIINIGLQCKSTNNLPKNWRIQPIPMGTKVGSLTVIGPMVSDSNGRKRQLCRCICNSEKLYAVDSLRAKKTTSCACQRNARSRIVVDGTSMGITAACRKYNIPRSVIAAWTKRGFTMQQAFDKYRLKLKALKSEPIVVVKRVNL